MNTEELKTFIFLSKVKNFTLAAEQMFIAQSTVTNRISELEKEVGKRLFSRGSKTVTLTEEGKIFLKYAERIIELQETSVEEMNAVSAYSRKFAVGAINATYESYVRPDRQLSEKQQHYLRKSGFGALYRPYSATSGQRTRSCIFIYSLETHGLCVRSIRFGQAGFGGG